MNAPVGRPVNATDFRSVLGFQPGPVFRVFGMRRSGNHAIIHWLQRNSANGHALFLNNCKRGKNPLEHFATLEIDGERAPERKARRDMPSVCARVGDGAMLVMSYEDCSPLELAPGRAISGAFDEGALDADIYIYRSFLNWLASLTKKLSINDNYTEADRGAILMRAMAVYTRMLQQVSDADSLGIVPVCYDDWVERDAYRATVLGALHLPQRDNSRGEVQRYGGGSSFQKEAGSVDDLKTSQRWQQMSGYASYQAILHLAARDDALVKAVSRFFPRDAEILRRIAKQFPLAQEVFQ